MVKIFYFIQLIKKQSLQSLLTFFSIDLLFKFLTEFHSFWLGSNSSDLIYFLTLKQSYGFLRRPCIGMKFLMATEGFIYGDIINKLLYNLLLFLTLQHWLRKIYHNKFSSIFYSSKYWWCTNNKPTGNSSESCHILHKFLPQEI